MAKKRNEVTGKAVAKLAGFLLQALKKYDDKQFMAVNGQRVVSVGVVKKICGSTLTQREPTRQEMVKDIENAMKSFMGVPADSEPIQVVAIQRKRNPTKRKPARKGRK